MHIKSIHLDGFKSYQKHTDITGFSPEFNAITGYNGSGKSNVLDSICFILGINKLDNIRAKSMSELISHGGTKATVQIRFDNRNKTLSPFSMEHFDEVVVQRTIVAQATGKGCATSYTLNGHAATNGKMQDFFRGIGLNVNNPHFLIMQGRITTVLNMKPEEILGMVEEAAGTKMYDQKKKDAEKTMFVKEVKLQEVDRIFKGSIDPRMEKFREDRKNMVEVTRLNKLKENSLRKSVAHEYWQSREQAKRDEVAIEVEKNEVEEWERKAQELAADLARKEDEKKEYERLRDHPEDQSELVSDQNKKRVEVFRLEADRNKLQESIDNLKTEIERIGKTITKDKAVLEGRKKQLEKTTIDNQNYIQKHQADEERIVSLRSELEELTRGTVANENGEHVSLESIIQKEKSEAATLEANIKTAQNRRERARKKEVDLKKQEETEAAKNVDEFAAIANMKQQMEGLREHIGKLKFDSVEDDRMQKRKQELEETVRKLDDEIDRVLKKANGGRFDLIYIVPPVPNFDKRNDVIGLLIHLTKIKAGREEFAVAIDTALGGAYYNVIVKNQETARILIDSKAFSGRKTMIPVSENYRSDGKHKIVSDAIVAKAQKIADRFNEKVHKLIDMVEYPNELDNTYLSLLGMILVVQTVECATEIAYSDAVKTRTVTTRGDDVKPSGVMSGGVSDYGSAPLLPPYEKLQDMKTEARRFSDELNEINKKFKDTEHVSRQHHDFTEKYEELERRLVSLQTAVNHSRIGLIRQEIADNDAFIETATKEIEDSSVKMRDIQAKISGLEARKNNDKGSQEKRKKDINTELQEVEKIVASGRDQNEKAKRAVMELGASVDELEKSVRNDEQDWENKKKELDKCEEDLPGFEQSYQLAAGELQATIDEMNARKGNQRNIIGLVAKATKECDILKKEEKRAKQKKEEHEKEIVRRQESRNSLRSFAEQQLRKNEWLGDEEAQFNKKGGLYDFEGYTTSKGHAELKELTDRIENLERTLCMKNVSNLDTCEAKVMEIKTKREKLLEDFAMLKKTIAVLDKKKVDELIRAHESVDKDFGKIFNCLLPDATAKLVPPEGKTVCEGLEVKVSFNGVQKDSLHELSGGQRSLVALSLILAMLKFKPAPLYILDEVDAALDLSHTANIGMMIKKHFTHNQFIIVSLKQGMFSNADALFQTHFADGHSTCTRLTGDALNALKADSKLAEQAKEMAETAVPSKKTATKKADKKSA